MKICVVCKKIFRKDEQLLVLAFPVTSLNANGDYSFCSDFAENETIVHYDCVKDYIPSILNPPSETLVPIKLDLISRHKTTPSEEQQIYKKVKEVFSDLGDKATLDEIREYCIINNLDPSNESDYDKLFADWFLKRNTLNDS